MAGQKAEFSQLQTQLLEAVFDEAALVPALKSFAELCNAPVSQLMVAQSNRTLLRSIFSVELDVDIAPTEALYQDINPRVLAIPRMQQDKASRDKDFIRFDDIRMDQTYQELILPAGLGHFSGVPLIHDETMTAGIALHRPLSGDPFSDEEARAHEFASAICKPVLQLAAKIEQHNVRSTLDLFGDGKAVAILDYLGRVMNHNDAFEAVIRQDVVRIDPTRKLILHNRSAEAALRKALGSHVGVTGGAFAAEARDQSSKWLLRVFPKPAFTIAGPEAGHALLVCEPLDQPARLDSALVRDVFGLTQAEGQVADLLFQGLPLRAIAERRNISVETVRTHTKKLLQKTECNRQAELVAKLARFTQ